KYVGEWNSNKMNGQGTLTWVNGNKYTGEWEDDLKIGQGSIKWANGNEYMGAWKNDKRHGQGTAIWPDGSIYDGEYKHEVAVGGWYYWPNGNISWSYLSQGKWVHKKFLRVHRTNFTNGEKYTGNIVNGNKHGQGIYIWANGNKFAGSFNQNKVNGHGIFIWTSGNKYVGEFQNEIAVGGWFYWADGSSKWSYISQGKWVHK
ncbi:MAG: phosphatidylinositol-4-phosphate 5-kinase, partial [Candidatus Scalindua sp.]|nr:phosphatidylinositol-4-phosphate 5-kinase [Candidatus Scalindua sp.]